MQITIGDKEFNEAVSCWLTTQGFNVENFDVSVNVIAGRKFGTTAEVSLTAKGSQPAPSRSSEDESESEDAIPTEKPPFKLGE